MDVQDYHTVDGRNPAPVEDGDSPIFATKLRKKTSVFQLVHGISSVGQPFPRPWFDIVSSHQDVAQLIKACVGMGWNSWCPGEIVKMVSCQCQGVVVV